MKKRYLLLSVILLLALLVIGGSFFSKSSNNEQNLETNKAAVEEEYELETAETITYENGDFVYVPIDDDIMYDSEDKMTYYKNILYVSLNSNISEQEADELAEIVDGNIVGRVQGAINLLQIQIEGETLEDINEHAKLLEDDPHVAFSEFSTPIFLSDFNEEENQVYYSKGHLEASEKENDENNWWMEAINAYPVWEYLDSHSEEFEKVKVAVFESGNLSKSYAKSNENLSEVDNIRFNRSSPHAQKVTKLITADEKTEGIRGVASGVVDVEFKNISKGPETIVLAALNEFLDNEEKVIINNSWGNRSWSEEYYETEKKKYDTYKKEDSDEYLSYEEYLEKEQNDQDEISSKIIIELDKVIGTKFDNFLLVQSAGNGYQIQHEPLEKPEQHGSKATLTGYFTNINDKTYRDALESREDINNNLEEILSRIIVVGGSRSDDGKSYYSPDWASYGNAIDIAAPAENINIPLEKNDTNSNWGTSYAAPMVTGAAALVWSYNPELSAHEVKDYLLNNAIEYVKEEKGDKDSYPMLRATSFLNMQNKYKPLIEIYRDAVNEQWDWEKLEKEDLGPDQYDRGSLAQDYGYTFMDINEDGVEEMILGVPLEDGGTRIEEIYTVVDQKVVKVLKSAIRRSYFIYEDGTIQENSVLNIHRGEARTIYYDLDSLGQLEQKDGYYHNWATDTYSSLNDPEELLSENDIQQKHEQYGNEIEFLLKSFTSSEENTD